MLAVVEGVPSLDIRVARRRYNLAPCPGSVAIPLKDGRNPQLGYVCDRANNLPNVGHVFYWLCPECSRRCRRLHITKYRIACRQCLRLVHHTQTLHGHQQRSATMANLRRKLGDTSGNLLGPIPSRPKGMRTKHYVRHVAKLEALQVRQFDSMIGAVEKLMQRHSPKPSGPPSREC